MQVTAKRSLCTPVTSITAGQSVVILDEKDRLATDAPFVQATGQRVGRRWSTLEPLGAKFFYVPETLIEAWGIRYGGARDSDYLFEIVESPNPSVTQVTQSLQISSKDFLEGFTVKGVLIQWYCRPAQRCVISYSLRDDRVAR